jgi:acetoacetyl-CoA synthetase
MRRAATGGRLFPPPRFFPDARLNFAENIFHSRSPVKLALIGAREGGTDLEQVTYSELQAAVQRVASAMRNLGICKGDRVAAIMSNSIASFVICLATMSIGAIFSSSATGNSPSDGAEADMGANGINDRLLQIRPKLIFADNGALYNGKIVSQIDKLRAIVKTLDADDLLHLIIIPRLPSQPQLLAGFSKSVTWDHFLSKSTNHALQFEQVEFNHPAIIVYSSGTTGKPKCIMHSHGV